LEASERPTAIEILNCDSILSAIDENDLVMPESLLPLIKKPQIKCDKCEKIVLSENSQTCGNGHLFCKKCVKNAMDNACKKNKKTVLCLLSKKTNCEGILGNEEVLKRYIVFFSVIIFFLYFFVKISNEFAKIFHGDIIKH
jgi:hypothetical protein